MTQGYDPYHLASPTVYLIKIVIFLIIVALVAAIISPQIIQFFWANPFINGLIVFTLVVGVFLSFRQIIRLFPEVKWVNSLQDGALPDGRPPVLLAPVAGILRDRLGEAVITPSSRATGLSVASLSSVVSRRPSSRVTRWVVPVGAPSSSTSGASTATT